MTGCQIINVEKIKKFSRFFSSLKDVPGPKKVIAQMCSMEAVQQNDGFTLFST